MCKNRVAILGSGRSGTSWVTEVCGSQKRYRILFEPAHPTNTQNGYLLADQYFRENDINKQAFRYLKKVMQNRINSDWVAQLSNRKLKMHLWPFLAKYYLIKFVRGNLLAPVIANELNTPVVFIVRDPLVTIESQLRVQFPWLFDLSRFAAQPSLRKSVEQHTGYDMLEVDDLSKVEVLTLRWGIENALLDYSQYNNIKVFHYEELKKSQHHFEDMMRWCNMNIPSDLDKRLQRPSSKSFQQIKPSKPAKDQQQSLIDNRERGKIKDILSNFPSLPYLPS